MIKPKHIAAAIIVLLFAACNKPDKPPPPPPPPPVLSSDKTITSFSFKVGDNVSALTLDADGTIGADTITVLINKGTDLSNLAPTITHTGVNITPGNRAAQNFNNTIEYTVRAEDGSTKKYTVKIVLVTANQKVYVGSDDGNLYALNALTGTMIWKYTTDGAILSSPCLANNTIYVGSMDKNLYAIDATTGTLKWKYLTNAPIRHQSPSVENGTVVITCHNNYPSGDVYAIDAVTGTLKWSESLAVPSTPLITDGKVIVFGIEGRYRAYNITDGSIAWNRSLIFIWGDAAVSDGKLYLVASNTAPNNLMCLDASTGNTIWNKECLSSSCSPTVKNGTVYLSSSRAIEQYSEAFSATDGSFKWRYKPIRAGEEQFPTYGAPAVLDSFAFPGYHLGRFYALNATTGALKWEFGDGTSGATWFANPTAANRTVYVGGYDKAIYALDAPSGKMLWKFVTSGNVYSGACVVDSDNNIFHAGSSGESN